MKTFLIIEDSDGFYLIDKKTYQQNILNKSFLQFKKRHKVIHTFQANNKIKAMQGYYDFLDLGTYKPMLEPLTNLPYPDDVKDFESSD